MVTLITILHIFVCIFLILVVLLQAGKGGGMGLAFGSSGAQTVFGGSGAGNFLTKLTAATAIMFMLTSLTLAYFASARESSWLDDYEKQMSNQLRREKEQRDKLSAATPRDAGAAAATDESSEAVDTGEAPATTGEPTPGGATAPAPAPAPAPANPTAPPSGATTAPAPAGEPTPPPPTKPAPASPPLPGEATPPKAPSPSPSPPPP